MCGCIVSQCEGHGSYIMLCSARTLCGISLRAALLLLAVPSPQSSDCFSAFGSSKAALNLTQEGMVRGVEQGHCSASGLSCTKGLWFLVSNQKASKEHWYLKVCCILRKSIDFILKIHYFPDSWRSRKGNKHYNSYCEHSPKSF